MRGQGRVGEEFAARVGRSEREICLCVQNSLEQSRSMVKEAEGALVLTVRSELLGVR